MFVVCYKNHVLTYHKSELEAKAKLAVLSRSFCNLEVKEKNEESEDSNGVIRSATA